MKAVILTSGGLDSTTLLSIVQKKDYDIYCLSFDYDQRNKSELKAIKKILNGYSSVKEHRVVKLDLAQFGGSSLTDLQMNVPRFNNYNKIPNTYVPARNTIFLSTGLAYAEVLDADFIYIGVNALDYSNYPDCRPEFIEAFNNVAKIATASSTVNRSIEIKAPLVNLTKAEIIQIGLQNGVDYSLTVSCYKATEEGLACGECDSCCLRKAGFQAANTKDPTRYIT